MTVACGFAAVALILGPHIALAGGKHNNAQQTVTCKSGAVTAQNKCKENGGTK